MIYNVLEYLKEASNKYPDRIAFVNGKKSITFSELDKRAKKMATKIVDFANGKTNYPIAVYLDKSIDSIVAFLSIIYSGNFYTPLDINAPVARTEAILRKLNPLAIITNHTFIGKIENVNIVKLDIKQEINDYINEKRLDFILDKKIDTDPLYVLFTSGSTGIPKGVVISHRSVIDYIEWVCVEFKINHNTIIGNQAPFYFDNSILDIYSTLKSGCTAFLIDESLFMFPQELITYLQENKISFLFWVPSALVNIANSGVLDSVKARCLKQILFCGEVMPMKQLNMWISSHPNVSYANLYGPTEITDVCAYYKVNRTFDDSEILPIGSPCKNTDILVLNDDNNIVEKNEIGELCVRGTCLSLGYYGDKNKTDQAFIQNPFNCIYDEKIYRTGDLVKYNEYGELVYICRKDYQIKHNGYRIELGEIENAVYSIEGIKQCCALYDNFIKKIVLFFSSEKITQQDVYSRLKEILPTYMLPSKIISKKILPLNPNGKIDRAFLQSNMLELKE